MLKNIPVLTQNVNLVKRHQIPNFYFKHYSAISILTKSPRPHSVWALNSKECIHLVQDLSLVEPINSANGDCLQSAHNAGQPALAVTPTALTKHSHLALQLITTSHTSRFDDPSIKSVSAAPGQYYQAGHFITQVSLLGMLHSLERERERGFVLIQMRAVCRGGRVLGGRSRHGHCVIFPRPSFVVYGHVCHQQNLQHTCYTGQMNVLSGLSSKGLFYSSGTRSGEKN